MVPHIKVEEKLHDLAGLAGQTFAVTGVADDDKGERLVVLHTLPQGAAQAVCAKLPQLDLPKLWIPRPDQFYRVGGLPVLGSGKLDLRKVRDLATRLALSHSGPTASDPLGTRPASAS